MSSMPSGAATPAAPARASGSVSASGAVSQSAALRSAGSGVSVKTVVVGAPSASRPPRTYTVPDTCTTLASERGSGSGGPSAHLSKLPIPEVGATKTVDCAAVPSVPPMYRILVPSCVAEPSVRGGGQVQLCRRLVPGRDRPDRRRARQGLVGRRAEIDRGPREDAQIHRPVDGEVVGAVGDVPEQQDDDDQPDEGLDPGPRPAVRVEQAEQGPLARHDHPGSERPLGHRPPSSPGDRSSRSPVDHCAVRVPVMLGCTEQTNGYAPAASAGTE